MSNRSPHRQVATFILAPGTAEEITAHGQLVTDPNYTSANRIEIFGVRGDELKFMLLSDKHVIAWHMYENEDWLEHANSSVKTFECGECYYKSAGATSGYNIGKNSIQIIADFIITDFKEINQHDRNGCDTYIFSFLPTPDSWRPYRRGASLRNPLVNFGQWKSITGTNLRFRRRLYGQVQKDDRVFDQDFIIWIPSIEIEKFESMEHRIDFKFEEIAEYINIANMFIYCDHFYEISRTELGQSSSTFIRFPVQLPQKAIGKMLRDRLILGKSEAVMAKVAEYLISHEIQKSELFGSVFRYVSSHRGPAIERQLVECVEALEALVNLYEKNKGWRRDSADRKTWKAAGRKFRSAIRNCEAVSSELRKIACDTLIYPPSISLHERIQKVIISQNKRWAPPSIKIKSKIKEIIDCRNKIVHGEVLDDANLVFYSLARAQFIFECLFCNLIGHSYRPIPPMWITGEWTP